MNNLRLLAPLLALTACQYDLDPLYEHETRDAGNVPGLSSQQLIGSWIGHTSAVDQECISCAEQKCASADALCRQDADCVAYTDCIGKNPTPAGQTACRAQFSSWVRGGDVRERDIVGPYGQCVFRYQCATECDGNVDLACLSTFAWPTTPVATVPLHLYLVDAQEQTMALPDLKVRACNAADVRCDNPLAEGKTDAAGLVNLQLPTGFAGSFTGYLEVTGGTSYPTLLKFSWNIGQETTYLVSIVNEQLFRLSIGAIGLKPDDKRGMLQLRMFGCSGVGVRGATFAADRADAQSRAWYIDVLPKLEATSTSNVGSGGIIDVPEGNTLVTAARDSDKAQIGRTDAPVRANTMTVVIFAPLPQ